MAAHFREGENIIEFEAEGELADFTSDVEGKSGAGIPRDIGREIPIK